VFAKGAAELAMSAEPEELEELEPDAPEADARKSEPPDAGETFMLTFATIGALALLDLEPASASLPSHPPLTIAQARGLLRNAPPPAATDIGLDPPAANDAAYQAAIAALNPVLPDEPPADSVIVPAGAGDGLGSPDVDSTSSGPHADFSADDAIGSSASPDTVFSLGSAVVAASAGAKLVISGDSDLALTFSADAVSVVSGLNAALQDVGVKVTLGVLDTLSLFGLGYEARATGAGDAAPLGANFQAAAYGPSGSTNVSASGSSALVIGAGNLIVVNSGTAAGGGGGPSLSSTSGKFVYSQGSSTVGLTDYSTSSAQGADAINSGANDYLRLFGAFDAFELLKTDSSAIAGVDADNALHPKCRHADCHALLDASAQAGGDSTLHFDGEGNSLTSAGLEKAAVAHGAHSDHIRLN
jgi:hypothetical protein